MIRSEWFASPEKCPNTGLYCRVERDSISIAGHRLTTFVITFPRIILCEVNTHCALSKNTSSSRAIPYSRPSGTRRAPSMREMVVENPYLPFYWGQNEKGMQAFGELPPDGIAACRTKILELRDNVVAACDQMWDIGLHKQDINRYLEPWAWTTQVITGTEWSNFFALRTDKFAHPAFQLISRMMYLRLRASTPRKLMPGEWHLPFTDETDTKAWGIEDLKRISVSRTARVSYNTMDGVRDTSKDFELYDKLIASRPAHMSPTTHQGTPGNNYKSNFIGWNQLRKEIAGENITSFEPSEAELLSWGLSGNE
jgi:hypothetical protein